MVGLDDCIMLADQRKLFQAAPDDVKTMWNQWVLRGLILISLASQVTLCLLGSVRKYNPSIRIRLVVWVAYILALAVGSAGLGVIILTALDVFNSSHFLSLDYKITTSELMSFWAPFFLLHLGGPDAITAFSMEDNELSLRPFVEIMFQSGVALYILKLSWPGLSVLPQLSIFVYLVSFVKCAERIQALWLANTEHLRDSLLGSPDPGPNYYKFMEDFHLRKSQGFNVDVEAVSETPILANDRAYPEKGSVISEAYDLFQKFRRIFVDLILTSEDRDNILSYFQDLRSYDAFHAVEIELGFAYDLFYTKANVVYTFRGIILRLTSILLFVLIPVGFYFLCDMNNYQFIDVVITYLLISTTLLMELFAVITLLRSDWTDHWLNLRNLRREILPFLKHPVKRRWSGSIAQIDLLSVALEEKPASFLQIQKFFGIDSILEKHRYRTYTKVSDDLKELIYIQLREFMVLNSDPTALWIHKGTSSLMKYECDSLLWSTTKVEFDQSILIWHIATTLCYYSELDNHDDAGIAICRTESKHISDYLLHLLLTYPVMLPIGIGMIRCRDTCAEATRFFKEKVPITEKIEACRKLLEVNCLEVLPSKVKGDRCKSALFDGCRLALTLKNMERGSMWKVMSQVWIEILAYAATHCRGFHHEQQLRKGGEFLTHVWLLMAHLGLTEHFQVSQGHARARFKVL